MHVHVQRLVSVVKMVIMLEEYNTEEQPSVMCFFFFFVSKRTRCKGCTCFPYMVGSVCHVKQFTTDWQMFH
jgi:hypothetical protein